MRRRALVMSALPAGADRAPQGRPGHTGWPSTPTA